MYASPQGIYRLGSLAADVNMTTTYGPNQLTPYQQCMSRGPCDPVACDYSICVGLQGDPNNITISETIPIFGGSQLTQGEVVAIGIGIFLLYKFLRR